MKVQDNGATMTATQELHKRAMEAAHEADAAREAKDETRAAHLFYDAFLWERQAAQSVDAALEPTRSILFRSAASLALDCGLAAEALDLVRAARAGTPPDAIQAELAEIEHIAEPRVHGLHRHAS